MLKNYINRVIKHIPSDTDKWLFLRSHKCYLSDEDYLDFLIEYDLEWVEEVVDNGSYIYDNLNCSLKLRNTDIYI